MKENEPKEIKSHDDLGISKEEWSTLASDFLISRDILQWINTESEIGIYHSRRFEYLGKLLGAL